MAKVLKPFYEFCLTLDKALCICRINSNPSGIKNIHSMYQAANPLITTGLLGCKREEDIIGKTDFDFPQTSSFAKQYVSCDKIALAGKPWAGIEPVSWRFLGVKTVFTVKAPIYDNSQEKIVGVFFSCFAIDEANFAESLSRLFKENELPKQDLKCNSCIDYPANLSTPYKITQRESSCLFYLVRGKSAKEIGKILEISPRTVESHIANLKEKFGCHYKSELIEKAIAHNFLSITPL